MEQESLHNLIVEDVGGGEVSLILQIHKELLQQVVSTSPELYAPSRSCRREASDRLLLAETNHPGVMHSTGTALSHETTRSLEAEAVFGLSYAMSIAPTMPL